jgi:hypothetical protein
MVLPSVVIIEISQWSWASCKNESYKFLCTDVTDQQSTYLFDLPHCFTLYSEVMVPIIYCTDLSTYATLNQQNTQYTIYNSTVHHNDCYRYHSVQYYDIFIKSGHTEICFKWKL